MSEDQKTEPVPGDEGKITDSFEEISEIAQEGKDEDVQENPMERKFEEAPEKPAERNVEEVQLSVAEGKDEGDEETSGEGDDEDEEESDEWEDEDEEEDVPEIRTEQEIEEGLGVETERVGEDVQEIPQEGKESVEGVKGHQQPHQHHHHHHFWNRDHLMHMPRHACTTWQFVLFLFLIVGVFSLTVFIFFQVAKVKLDERENQLAALRAENDLMAEEVDRLRERLNTTRNGISALEDRYSGLEKLKNNTLAKIASLTEENKLNAQRERELEVRNIKLFNENKELELLNSSPEKVAEFLDLQEKNRELKKQVDSLIEKSVELDNAYKQLQTQESETLSSTIRLSQENQELHHRVFSTSQERDISARRASRVESFLKIKQSELSAIKTQKNETTGFLNRSLEVVDELSKMKNRLKGQIRMYANKTDGIKKMKAVLASQKAEFIWDFCKRETLECQRCPMGADWIAHENQCIRLPVERGNWEKSRHRCTHWQGQLAVVESPGRQQVLTELSVGKSVWIGLTDLQKEGTFVWVNGKSLTENMTFWDIAQPSDKGNADEVQKAIVGADCVGLEPKNAQQLNCWNDLSCSMPYHFFCEVSALNVPDS